MKAATQLAHASCLKAHIRTTALLGLCALASATAVAGGQPDPSVTRSGKVSLADLNLSTPEGANAARDRLRQAARRLCARVADELDLSHQANYVACVDESLAVALRKITEAATATASNTSVQTSAGPKTGHQPVHSAAATAPQPASNP